LNQDFISMPNAQDTVEKVQTHFQDYRLNSAFQPIFGLGHRRAVGFEALIRARSPHNEPASPAVLFQKAKELSQTQTLDRICQQLHIHHFAQYAPDDRWLFLNVDTETITSKSYRDGFLAQSMAAEQLPFHQLVVEITEGAIRDKAVLIDAVEHFRGLGALVALDDFGTGYSNFDRIWRLAPDIIKLDRSIVVESAQHGGRKLRRMLPNLVSMMHEAGIMVLAEGVETKDQGLMALDADIDFVQGFYFGRPLGQINESTAKLPGLEQLTADFADTAVDQDCRDRQLLAPYIDMFRASAEAIEQGCDIDLSCRALLDMPRTERCYLLDARGEELAYLPAPIERRGKDARCRPIADTAGAAWFRRPYFRAALYDRRRVKTSRPFLSATDMSMCITLSIAGGGDDCRVLCCDIIW
jgi:EAL domain-containing protein (putative c-di-GMP-specific phosphodiesterase class I)